MKRFLTGSFIALALLIGATGAAPVARAAVGDACTDANGNAGIVQNGGVCAPDAATTVGTQPDGTTVAPADAAQVAAAAQIPTPPQKDDTSALASVMTTVLSVFAWFITAAMITLNYAVYYTIIKMGTYVNQLSAIGVTWRILRDVANIMFLFGFIASGIAILLDTEQYGFKKMLPMLLMGAIFLNFSLFITEALIDGTNVFAIQFYKQINGGTLPDDTSIKNNRGLADKIMDQIGLQTIYTNAEKNGSLLGGATNTILVSFMGIILFLTTAFVLFSLAFILIARFVALIFFIILSPVGFMGLALPGMQHRMSQWWSGFLGQIITAPVLMLLLYVALKVITDVSFKAFGSVPNWTGAFGDSGTALDLAGFGAVLLSYLVAMGLLLMVVIKAKSMSAFGAGQATALAGKLTYGATAWATNRTVGRGAYYLKRRAQQSAGFNKFDAWTGRGVSRALGGLATASYDTRGLLKNLPAGASIAAGEVAKDGFVGARKRSIEDHENAAKDIETAHKEGFSEAEETEAKAKHVAEEQKALEKVKDANLELKGTQSSLKQDEAKLKADIARLEEESKNAPVGDIQALETINTALDQKRKALDANTKNLKTTEDQLEESDKALKRAQKTFYDNTTEPAQDKAAAKVLADKIKKSKIAYAEGIDHPIWNVLPISPNLYAYGPAAGEAARKIKKSTKDKSNDQKLLDAVRAATEGDKPKEEKGHGEDKGGHTTSAPKDSTGGVALAPAPTGGAHGPK